MCVLLHAIVWVVGNVHCYMLSVCTAVSKELLLLMDVTYVNYVKHSPLHEMARPCFKLNDYLSGKKSMISGKNILAKMVIFLLEPSNIN